MAAEQRHTKAGQAVYRHPGRDHEIVLSWGAGYPAVEAPSDPETGDPYELLPGSDDPGAELEDVPEPEAEPEPETPPAAP